MIASGEAARARGGDVARQWLSVVVVEVPLPARGLVGAVHQQAGGAPHLTIEELHSQLFPPLRPGPETIKAAQEARILADLHRQPSGLLPAAHILRHTPFPGMGAEDARGAQRRRGAGDLAGERVGVRGIVEPAVLHPYAARTQAVGEMAHRREHQHDLLLVVADIGAFAAHLGHQHDIARRVEPLQRRHFIRALVAQHDSQRGHSWSASPLSSLRSHGRGHALR